MAARQITNPKRELILDDHALMVNILDLPSSDKVYEEKIRDRLQIYFQRKRHGGGDVDKVLFPLQANPMKAIIIFSTEAEVDFDKLVQKEATIKLAADVDMIVETSRLPPVFQEVRLVVDPFYLSLVPRDKEDDLKKMLQKDARATLDHSNPETTINVSMIKHVHLVQDVIFRVAGLQIDDKSATETANKLENQNGYDVHQASQQQEMSSTRPVTPTPNSSVSTDGSVRPKYRPSEDGSLKQNHQLELSPLSTNHESTDDNMLGDSGRMSNERYTEEGSSQSSRKKHEKPHQQSSRMAASFSNEDDNDGQSNSGLGNSARRKINAVTDHADGSDVDGPTQLPNSSEGAPSSNEPPHVGPFSVNTLLFQYLVNKQSSEMNKIRKKYRIEVVCKADNKQEGQGEIYIVHDDKVTSTKSSAKEMEQAGDDFVSLYQSFFQHVIISKPILCQGVGLHKINEAKSIIWTEQSSVMIEDSIDDEVTFVGKEEEVSESIKTFRKVIGLQSRSRKLKNTTQPTNTEDFSFRSDSDVSRTHSKVSDRRPVSSKVNDKVFKTDEGVTVIARKDDITTQVVNVIVNASDIYLSNNGGVAKALVCAAGRALQDECNEIKDKSQSSLTVGKCVYTKGCRLSCDFVIHAIGPTYSTNINSYDDSAFFNKLKETFLNSLNLANDLAANSIALPLISSGVYGGPKDVCARALVGAIKQYSRMKNKTVETILLVNKDDKANDAVYTQLNWLQSSEDDDQMEVGSETRRQQSSATAHFWTEKVQSGASATVRSVTDKRSANNHKSDKLNENIILYEARDFQVIREQRDILEVVKGVDGIIVPTDNMLSNNYGIAKHVAKAAGSRLAGACKDIVAKEGGFQLLEGEVKHTYGFNLLCDEIVFTVAPDERRFDGRRQELFQELRRVVWNCLKYADARNLRSVALPLFPGDSNLKELYSSAFARAFHQFVDFGPKSIRRILIVNDDVESNMALQVSFDDEFNVDKNQWSGHEGFRNSGATNAHQSSESNVEKHGQNYKPDNDNIVKEKEPGNPSDGSEDEEEKKCPICLEDFSVSKPPKDLDKCKHKFCKECWDEVMKHKPACPICGVLYGTIKGNQPPGRMDVSHTQYGSLPGYEGCGMITINYSFPSGKQGPNHPEPGNYYSGTSRTAYLPNNADGNRVVNLLRKAFDAGLVFTIGTSVTTGAKNMVTWNDIHHKTSPRGGTQAFGYPDPTYLKRVTEELAAKGIK